MNKEEILERSRKENKNQDFYEKEVIIQGNRFACLTAAILATIFFVIQFASGNGMDYGLYAVVSAMPMSIFWIKYKKLHKKHELFSAVCYTIATLAFSTAHIFSLISLSHMV